MSPLLERPLKQVADRRRTIVIWSQLALCWAVAAIIGLSVLGLEKALGWTSVLALPILLAAALISGIVIVRRQTRKQPEWRSLAAKIESRFSDLDGRLLTAVQQEGKAGGALNFLQERLAQEVLLHRRQNDWTQVFPLSRVALVQSAHWLSVLLLGIILLNLRTTGGHNFLTRIADEAVTVSPAIPVSSEATAWSFWPGLKTLCLPTLFWSWKHRLPRRMFRNRRLPRHRLIQFRRILLPGRFPSGLFW
jgi:hypothetical protein